MTKTSVLEHLSTQPSLTYPEQIAGLTEYFLRSQQLAFKAGEITVQVMRDFKSARQATGEMIEPLRPYLESPHLVARQMEAFRKYEPAQRTLSELNRRLLHLAEGTRELTVCQNLQLDHPAMVALLAERVDNRPLAEQLRTQQVRQDYLSIARERFAEAQNDEGGPGDYLRRIRKLNPANTVPLRHPVPADFLALNDRMVLAENRLNIYAGHLQAGTPIERIVVSSMEDKVNLPPDKVGPVLELVLTIGREIDRNKKTGLDWYEDNFEHTMRPPGHGMRM